MHRVVLRNILLATAALLAASCDKSAPPGAGDLVEPAAAATGGYQLLEFSETIKEENDKWQAVRKTTADGAEMFIRRIFSYDGGGGPDDLFIDIPISNARSLLEFVALSQDAEIRDKKVATSRLIFHPVLGSNYWIRKTLPAGTWDEGPTFTIGGGNPIILNIQIDSFEKSLKKALEAAEALGEAKTTQ